MMNAGTPSAAATYSRAIFRAVVVVLASNCLFFLLVFVAPGDRTIIQDRVRDAFATGELGFRDFLFFDAHRGFNQYNDCNVLQMLANQNPSRLARALSPVIYSTEAWVDQCSVLYRAAVAHLDPSTLVESRYSRYWHGYNAAVAIALRSMQIRTLRRALAAAVWLSMTAFALLTFLKGGAVRRTGLAITIAAAAFWAIPYFSPSFTHGFGDAAVFLGLAVLASQPYIALRHETLLPYAAGFGAVVVFFEMLTGQLPIAAAWLMAVIVAVWRDDAPGDSRRRVLAVAAAVIAFGIGALVTEATKQILAYALTDPEAGGVFFSHLVEYSATPTSRRVPGVLRPFAQLVRQVSMLTYGSSRVGYVLIAMTVAVWVRAAVNAFRGRRLEGNVDRVVLLAAALVPVVWVFILPQHSLIHAAFMIRIFIVSISLAPLALFWRLPRRAAPVDISGLQGAVVDHRASV